MNLPSKISVAISMLFSFSSCNAQIKNAKTESLKIFGNCEMCEKTIETAGNAKKVARVDWNKDTKMATITYDSTKTNQEEILKRIALSGYDSDQFLAPDDVYAKLPECCQYVRTNKTAIAQNENIESHSVQNNDTLIDSKKEVNQLQIVFESYFALKDALVKSDEKLASSFAKKMLSTINGVAMDKLTTEEHIVWMRVLNNLKSNAEAISIAASIEKQRNDFMNLSTSIYELLKVSKQETPIFYQNCPMYNDGKGANWLSKESAIKNPYYGSQMLTCGKTIETIK